MGGERSRRDVVSPYQPDDFPLVHWHGFDWTSAGARSIGQRVRLFREDKQCWESGRVMNFCATTEQHYVLFDGEVKAESWVSFRNRAVQIVSEVGWLQVPTDAPARPVLVWLSNKQAKRTLCFPPRRARLVQFLDEPSCFMWVPRSQSARFVGAKEAQGHVQRAEGMLRLISEELETAAAVRRVVADDFTSPANELCKPCSYCRWIVKPQESKIGPLCPPCHSAYRKGNYCPVCLQLWTSSDDKSGGRGDGDSFEVFDALEDLKLHRLPPKDAPSRALLDDAEAHANRSMLQCEVCDLWTHATCDGISQEEYDRICSANSKHLTVAFIGPCCRVATTTRMIDLVQKLDRTGLFEKPVTEEIAPGYHAEIPSPMDFTTMRAKALRKVYKSAMMLRTDVELIVRNCLAFNSPHSPIWQEARNFFTAFLRLVRPDLFSSTYARPKDDLGSYMYAIMETVDFSDKVSEVALEMLRKTTDTSYTTEIATRFRRCNEIQAITARLLAETPSNAQCGEADASLRAGMASPSSVIQLHADPWPAAGMPPRFVKLGDAPTTQRLALMDWCSACASKGAQPLKVCADCGEAYHEFCCEAFYWTTNTKDPNHLNAWLCPNCALCGDCLGDGCVRCVDRPLCSHCKLPVTPTTDRRCGKLSSSPGIFCSSCSQPVHAHCDSGAMRAFVYDVESFVCQKCQRDPAPKTHAGASRASRRLLLRTAALQSKRWMVARRDEVSLGRHVPVGAPVERFASSPATRFMISFANEVITGYRERFQALLKRGFAREFSACCRLGAGRGYSRGGRRMVERAARFIRTVLQKLKRRSSAHLALQLNGASNLLRSPGMAGDVDMMRATGTNSRAVVLGARPIPLSRILGAASFMLVYLMEEFHEFHTTSIRSYAAPQEGYPLHPNILDASHRRRAYAIAGQILTTFAAEQKRLSSRVADAKHSPANPANGSGRSSSAAPSVLASGAQSAMTLTGAASVLASFAGGARRATADAEAKSPGKTIQRSVSGAKRARGDERQKPAKRRLCTALVPGGSSAVNRAPTKIEAREDARVCVMCKVAGDSAALGRMLVLPGPMPLPPHASGIEKPSASSDSDGDATDAFAGPRVAQWIHFGCLTASELVSKSMATSGQTILSSVPRELVRASCLACHICGAFGASLRCDVCNQPFHLSCGVRAGSKARCAAHAAPCSHDVDFCDHDPKTVICFNVEKDFLSDLRPPSRPTRAQLSWSLEMSDFLRSQEIRGKFTSRALFARRDSPWMRIGSLTVHAIGEVPEHNNFHRRHLLIPVGYRATRLHWSWRSRGRRCAYLCEVRSTARPSADTRLPPNARPLYRVTALEASAQGDDPFLQRVQGSDLDVVVLEVRRRINASQGFPVPKEHAHGWSERFFGLSIPQIRAALENQKCSALSAALTGPGDERYRFSFLQPSEDEVQRFTRNLRAQDKYDGAADSSERSCSREKPFVRGESGRTKGERVSKQLALVRKSASDFVREEFAVDFLPPAEKAALYMAMKKRNDSRGLKEMLRENKRVNRAPFSVKRSPIHGWGLFAERDFEKSSMMVEYSGETIGNAVGDAREAFYEKVGIGSCYLFRIGKDEILDATRCGGYARFINHCCDPNAFARIVDLGAAGKKIVICARRDVLAGEEVTYDYKFAAGDELYVCNCGAQNCRGAMN